MAAALLYATGLVHLFALLRRALGRGGAIFLTGHRVVPAATGDAVDRMALICGHAITPEELARRLQFLLRWVMPAGRAASLRSGPPSERAFFLTFDDGYRDNVEHAGPVLERLGVEAVIFIVADLVAHPSSQPWWDRWGADALQRHAQTTDAVADYNRRCTEAKRACSGLDDEDKAPAAVRRYLNGEELAALPPLFHVANHSKSHANFECLDPERLREQIEGGEAAIAGHPRRLPLLAFPFGARNRVVLDELERDGRFAIAFATGGGVDADRHQVRRLNLNVKSFPMFAAQAVGLMR